MAEKGGGFLYIVASLRDYGLVSGTGTIMATEDAKIITAGTAEEASKARARAFLNVGLFKKLKEKIGTNVPTTEQFSVLLGEITSEDRLKVKEKAETIRNLYLDGVPYLKSIEEERKKVTDEEKVPPPAGVEVFTFGSNISIQLPKDNIKQAWKKAKTALDVFLGEETNTEKSEGEA